MCLGTSLESCSGTSQQDWWGTGRYTGTLTEDIYSLRTSWHFYLGTSWPCLSRLIPTFFGTSWHTISGTYWHTWPGFYPYLFLGILFKGLSRFIPTLFFGHIIALHRGHLSTIDTIADRIVFTRLHSFTLHSLTLPLEPTLSKTVLHLSHSQPCTYSTDSCTSFGGYHSNCSSAHLTLVAGHGFQLGLLYQITILFLGIRTLASSLIHFLIFGSTLFIIVGGTLLSVSGLVLLLSIISMADYDTSVLAVHFLSVPPLTVHFLAVRFLSVHFLHVHFLGVPVLYVYILTTYVVAPAVVSVLLHQSLSPNSEHSQQTLITNSYIFATWLCTLLIFQT